MTLYLKQSQPVTQHMKLEKAKCNEVSFAAKHRPFRSIGLKRLARRFSASRLWILNEIRQSSKIGSKSIYRTK